MSPRSLADAFVAAGRELSALESAIDRMRLPAAERNRARRMAAAARENLAEALSSAGRFAEHVRALGARS